ncbi:unnamed protein product [Rhizophagus irregularis]|nr:unnamed protein product [Rhizophagus irregularis]
MIIQVFRYTTSAYSLNIWLPNIHSEEFLLPTMMDSKFTNLVEQFISVETSYYTQLLSKFIMQLIHLKHHGGKPNLKTVNEAREELDKTMKNYGG